MEIQIIVSAQNESRFYVISVGSRQEYYFREIIRKFSNLNRWILSQMSVCHMYYTNYILIIFSNTLLEKISKQL